MVLTNFMSSKINDKFVILLNPERKEVGHGVGTVNSAYPKLVNGIIRIGVILCGMNLNVFFMGSNCN